MELKLQVAIFAFVLVTSTIQLTAPYNSDSRNTQRKANLAALARKLANKFFTLEDFKNQFDEIIIDRLNRKERDENEAMKRQIEANLNDVMTPLTQKLSLGRPKDAEKSANFILTKNKAEIDNDDVIGYPTQNEDGNAITTSDNNNNMAAFNRRSEEIDDNMTRNFNPNNLAGNLPLTHG